MAGIANQPPRRNVDKTEKKGLFIEEYNDEGDFAEHPPSVPVHKSEVTSNLVLLIILTVAVTAFCFGWTDPGYWLKLRLSGAEKILANDPLIDGHVDLLILIRELYGNQIYSDNFTTPFENGGMYGQLDIPRLEAGKMGGAFWSAFVPCPADGFDFSDENYAPYVRSTLEQIDLFHRLARKYPRYFTLSRTAKEAEYNFYVKKRMISPLAIEGLHQIGNSLSTLRLYHELGVRYATLTWNCHNKYADAAVVSIDGESVRSKPFWGGISPAGRKLILEMNRLGMIVDLSHVSADTMRDALGGSSDKEWSGSVAPPIFSHSSAYSLCPHPRNVPDDVLQLVKKRNSLVMVNFAPDFISCKTSNASSGLPEFVEFTSTIEQVAAHILHIGKLIGFDHVGIGSDYDGIPNTPRGLEDVSKYPALIDLLLKSGVSEDDVSKVAGRNLLRVWKEVDKVASRLQKKLEPLEDDLPHHHWDLSI